jgi:hypothetical protein
MESSHTVDELRPIGIKNGRQEGDSDQYVEVELEQQPDISVVMPTLDEEQGIGECIQRVERAFKQMDVTGEIIISDSSSDRTPEIAREMGARVVTPDGQGYGYAYRYAIERARADVIAMGDADTTYDFEELPELVAPVVAGEADMVLGSRLDGEILPGSMPPLHEFVGNPLLTRLLNIFYGTDVSDAHSGMRVFTKEAYNQMNLDTTGMEFASEMIMQAGANDLRIREVPITYHPRAGEATLSSFRDGWRHVRFMLLNAPGYLFTGPGILLGVSGLSLLVLAISGVTVGTVAPGVNSTIAGSLVMMVGVQATSLGVFATLAGEPINGADDPLTTLIIRHFKLKYGATAGVLLIAVGVVVASFSLFNWVTAGYEAVPGVAQNVLGFTAVVLGIHVVFASFLLSMFAKEDEV